MSSPTATAKHKKNRKNCTRPIAAMQSFQYIYLDMENL